MYKTLTGITPDFQAFLVYTLTRQSMLRHKKAKS